MTTPTLADAKRGILFKPFLGDAIYNGRKANARLIAAAPELLAIVEGFLTEGQIERIAKPCSIANHGCCTVHDMGPCLIGDARALLAKLKGPTDG